MSGYYWTKRIITTSPDNPEHVDPLEKYGRSNYQINFTTPKATKSERTKAIFPRSLPLNFFLEFVDTPERSSG